MENENKNIPEGTEVGTPEKKLNLPVIIGSAVAAVVVILGIIVAVVLLGGEKCTAHIDADDDKKCDICGVDYDDGDEVVITTTDVTILIKDSEGNALSDITFTLSLNDISYTLTTDANGKAQQTLSKGRYDISYLYQSFPDANEPEGDDEYIYRGAYQPQEYYISVGNDTKEVTLTIVDKSPNGTSERPYLIVDQTTSLTLPADTTVYYMHRNPSGMRLVIENAAGITVLIGDNEHTPDGTTIDIMFNEDITTTDGFLIGFKNNTDTEISAAANIYPLGTMNNPIVLVAKGTKTVIEMKDITPLFGQKLYYVWVAPTDAPLTVTTDVGSLLNMSKNGQAFIHVGETGTITDTVEAGDEIIFEVSSGTGDSNSIDFEIDFTPKSE